MAGPGHLCRSRRAARRRAISSSSPFFAADSCPPFIGKRLLEVLNAHTSAAVLPPSEVQPGVPADLEAVVLRLLAKEPAARSPDAGAVESALARCGCAGQWSEADAAHWWAGQPPLPAATVAEPGEKPLLHETEECGKSHQR
jgi:hypothetical protein